MLSPETFSQGSIPPEIFNSYYIDCNLGWIFWVWTIFISIQSLSYPIPSISRPNSIQILSQSRPKPEEIAVPIQSKFNFNNVLIPSQFYFNSVQFPSESHLHLWSRSYQFLKYFSSSNFTLSDMVIILILLPLITIFRAKDRFNRQLIKILLIARTQTLKLKKMAF